jgi:hypothetical protein
MGAWQIKFVCITGALILVLHGLDAMHVRVDSGCERRGSSLCFRRMQTKRPTRMSLRGGSDPFWGRSYPWEAVGSPEVPLYYEVLGISEDATLTDVSTHAESSSRTRMVSDVFLCRSRQRTEGWPWSTIQTGTCQPHSFR